MRRQPCVLMYGVRVHIYIHTHSTEHVWSSTVCTVYSTYIRADVHLQVFSARNPRSYCCRPLYLRPWARLDSVPTPWTPAFFTWEELRRTVARVRDKPSLTR